jgi:ribosomal protein S12 methylthiotransferase accessory factor
MDIKEMKVTFPGGLRVDAAYKGFTIKTDQPVHEGGEGTVPSPFDLFLASLGTCAGYYVLAFCRQRGIPTENASVEMKMTKSAGSKMIEKVSIEILLPAEFPEKYKTAVVKAADTCTVKAHIAKPPLFEITAKIG